MFINFAMNNRSLNLQYEFTMQNNKKSITAACYHEV
jgi:hypothetical protein